jgi:ABC-type enterochelin transport system permease subunit
MIIVQAIMQFFHHKFDVVDKMGKYLETQLPKLTQEKAENLNK